MATIKDVAKQAGVSVGTVSRAFNNYKDISPTTKERIFAVAEELNYSPNIIAKSLSSKMKAGIGVIISGIVDGDGRDNVSFSILQSVAKVANREGVDFSLYAIDSNMQKNISFRKFCEDRNLAGVIVQGIKTDDPYFQELVESDFPCVVIDVKGKTNHYVGVMSDNIEAAQEMTDFMFENGHRAENICVLAGSKNAMVTIERTAGIFASFHAHGEFLQRKQIITANFTEEDAYMKISVYLRKQPNLTGIICMSDLMAIAAIKAVQEYGLKVPEDISIIGFDGIPLSAYVYPSLTTIEQDFGRIAETAAVELLRLIKTKEFLTPTIYIPHHLVIRKSVKKV